MRTDERVEALAGEYLQLLESGQAPDLESYLEGLPSGLQEDVGALCRQTLEVQAILDRRGGRTPRARREPTARFEEFELGEELGRGTHGVVYGARWPASDAHPTDEVVALKVLHGVRLGAGRAAERFAQEIEIARQLAHPGLVRVRAWGQGPDGPFFAMELVEGESLAERIRRAQASGEAPGPAAITEAARLVAELAEALQHAHERGVVHRDVKPANVLIDRDGRARLSDFGLAKLAGEPSLSRSGELTGTAAYISPEQGLVKKVAVDGRSDVFSLGVILYELLTLQRPFVGESLADQLARNALQRPVPVRQRNPRVPADLEVLCHRALEKSPADRVASAGELAAELRRFLAHEAIRTTPVSRRVRWWRALQRHPGRVAVAVVGALALVAMAAVGRAVAAARHVDDMLAPLRELAREPQLGERRHVELQAARERIAELRARDLDADDRAVLDDLDRRIREHGDDAARRGWALVEQGRGSPPGTDLASFRSPSEWALHAGIAELRRADDLLPPDPRRSEFLARDPTLPRLSVALAEPGSGPAQAFLRLIDRITGEVGPDEPLGPLPIEDLAVPRGYYRIVVEGPAGFAEMTRLLDAAGERLAVRAWLRPTEEVTADMVRIEGGPFRFGMPEPDPAAEHREREVIVDGFHVDPCEVTNGEYRAFVLATGHRAPHFWPETYDPAWDDLPLVGVSFADAQAYAEWHGKRLPTHAEWERAGRGRHGRRFPWGDEPGDVRALSVVGLRDEPEPEGERPIEAGFAHYLRGVRPVGSRPADRTPEGVHDLLGSVSEWTETMLIGMVEDRPQPFVHRRFGKGLSWKSDPEDRDLTSYIELMVGWTGVNTLGFRCAKSTQPRGK